jgi:hypothetical protein
MRSQIRLFSMSLVTACVLGLSTVSPAQAVTRRFSQQISGGSSFEQMMQQAEAIAEATANQAFSDPSTTDIVVNIAGEQEGQVVPMLLLNLTRANWQQQQDISVWAKYPGGVKRLLGFERPSPLSPVGAVVTASNPIRDRMTEREANFYK